MKKAILLVLLAFFSFSATASAAYTETMSGMINPGDAGNYRLNLGIEGHPITENAVVTVYFKYSSNGAYQYRSSHTFTVPASSYSHHQIDIGSLPSGYYKIDVTFNGVSYAFVDISYLQRI
ncbi:hypothetical protein [Paenibacillus glacialis]|uniref:Uncharacterized protein n=1 Tax=Paenibacillus glacialis TaxID=494026 RepID=A0A162K7Y4_9BACL|nr:hypothetical protein [Paenibacillus glacialis]OAB41988.1 hypothetical protein PGLA_14290 [Paenibacillus glacialis]